MSWQISTQWGDFFRREGDAAETVDVYLRSYRLVLVVSGFVRVRGRDGRLTNCHYLSSPLSAMTTLALGVPLFVPCFSIALTTLMPSTTLPNTTCFPFSLGKKKNFYSTKSRHVCLFFNRHPKNEKYLYIYWTCISRSVFFLMNIEVKIEQHFKQEVKIKLLVVVFFCIGIFLRNCPMLLHPCQGQL